MATKKNEKDAEAKELANLTSPSPVKVEEKPEAPKAAEKPVEVPKAVASPKSVKREPAWDQDTWLALSNLKLGVAPFVLAGAFYGTKNGEVFTEVDVRRRLKAFLDQSV